MGSWIIRGNPFYHSPWLLPPCCSVFLTCNLNVQQGECSATQLSQLSWVGCASVPSGRQKPAGAVSWLPPWGATLALFGDMLYNCPPCKLLLEPVPAVVGLMPSWVSDSGKETVLFPKGSQSSEAEIQKAVKLKINIKLSLLLYLFCCSFCMQRFMFGTQSGSALRCSVNPKHLLLT